MVQLSMIFTELMQVQNATLPIEPNMDLVNTVRVRSAVSCQLLTYVLYSFGDLTPLVGVSKGIHPVKIVMLQHSEQVRFRDPL